MRLWMGSELTRSETSRRSGIYPYIRIAPDATVRRGLSFIMHLSRRGYMIIFSSAQ